MEHIVQFGINIDDESIKKAIENNVMKQVAESIKQDAMKRLVGKNEYSNYEYTITLDEIIKSVVNEFLDVNRDKIIEETSKN